jgi:hypothetical protein
VETLARDLPKLTTDLEISKRDLDDWGYCLFADAISEELRKQLLDRPTEQAEMEGEHGLAYMADGHSPARRIGSFDQRARPVWQSYCILDTWYVGGLRGAASHDVIVEDVFVPAERTFDGSQAARSPSVSDVNGCHYVSMVCFQLRRNC